MRARPLKNRDATSRLAEFFSEIKTLAQFMDCDEVNVHTRGFQGETPLKIAVVRQDLEVVTDLLRAGADPNLQGEDGETPLHHAAARKNVEIVRLLLAHGASPHIRSDLNSTPLEKAQSFARINKSDAVLLAIQEVA